jgi:tRNA pseudouridine65 synthase
LGCRRHNRHGTISSRCHFLPSRASFGALRTSTIANALSIQWQGGNHVEPTFIHGNVTILARTDRYVVVAKPPTVVCHHSEWTGSRSDPFQIPMLQRTREAMGGNCVNLVHRLNWGCSGCLLLTYAADTADAEIYIPNTTATLIASMKETASLKTYLALVRGEGLLQGRDFKQEGWFKVDRPIKNEKGILNNATTWFRFVAGQDNDSGRINQPRASLVLARPETGRWHQIRRHLNGLSHPILGDTSHGNSHVNREWRDLRGMPAQRTCLHLARLQLGPN